MATKQPGVWGIDLGQCALKAIRLAKVDGQVTATAFDYIEHPKILSQPDADPDQLLRQALEKFLSRNELHGDRVAISVPGQNALARFIKLPRVQEGKIADIVRFEAKLQIPFPLDVVVWDFQKIGAGVVTDGFALETEIGLFAMKRDLVTRYLQHFTDVGVEVHIVQMAPLALCNYVSYDLLTKPTAEDERAEDAEGVGKRQCVAALDTGADSSNLVVTDGTRILWQRQLPLGGSHVTRALTRDLKLTFAKAEHVKRNPSAWPDLRTVLAALKPILDDFVAEVQRSLGYFTTMHRDAHVKYMIGLGNAFRLPGLQKYLEEKLQLEVRKLTKINRLGDADVTRAPQFVENVPSFAVAYGLALQGFGLTTVHTNLLPPEIRAERAMRAKKPWAVAAAAVLLLAVAGLALGRSAQYRAVRDPMVKSAIAQGDKVMDHGKELSGRYAGLEAEIAASKAAAARIVAGVDRRFDWHLLVKYINDSLPQPDGPGLAVRTRRNAAPREDYDTADARKAYQLLRHKEMVPPGAEAAPAQVERRTDDFIKQKLIQINIEGIASLYSDDLPGTFFKQLAEVIKDRAVPGLGDAERRQLAHTDARGGLPRSGWVFEIRGSTCHEKGADFVLNTLVENLANPEAEGLNRKLSREMKERVKDRIGFVCLYAAAREDRSEVGAVARTSRLPGLLQGGSRPGAARGASSPSLNRDGWQPLGHRARSALGGGGSAGPSLAGTSAGGPGRRPRTEFAILFIWQEPVTPNGPGPAADAAADDD